MKWQSKHTSMIILFGGGITLLIFGTESITTLMGCALIGVGILCVPKW